MNDVRHFVILATLACLLPGCGNGAPASPDLPRRIADYNGSPGPTTSDDQCRLPAAKRTGGWFCYGTASPTP